MVTRDTEENGGIPLGEALRWAEFCCWTTLALTPMLYWVNGSSVSTDQLVVRTTLVIVAAVGAATLRLWNWRNARRRRQTGPG